MDKRGTGLLGQALNDGMFEGEWLSWTREGLFDDISAVVDKVNCAWLHFCEVGDLGEGQCFEFWNFWRGEAIVSDLA